MRVAGGGPPDALGAAARNRIQEELDSPTESPCRLPESSGYPVNVNSSTSERGAVSGWARRDVLSGIRLTRQLARKRRNEMRMRFLIIGMALASVFATQQQAVAKIFSTSSSAKKHHKKHAKKNQTTTGTAARQAK